MKNTFRLLSVLLSVVILLTAAISGCGKKSDEPSTDVKGEDILSSDCPIVLFGENIRQNGMTVDINGTDKLNDGAVLGKEYSKISKENTLSFKLDNDYCEKLDGKSLFIKLEYYESSSKTFKLGYEGASGNVENSYEMAGGSVWGGMSIKTEKVKFSTDAKSHFTVKLDTASTMWLHSVSISENTISEQKYPQLLATDYETSNGRIIEANVKDFGAAGDGKTDDSLAFRTAIRSLEGKGGVIYAPKGTYLLTQDFVIPSGVTLLGDFNAPSRENPKAEGTILAAKVSTIADGSKSMFITMRQGSCVKGLTIWYPEQTLASGEATPYNYTIGISDPINVAIEDIYLVNSYDGITHDSYDNAHYQQMVKNIYGTPLHVGYMSGKASDSDRQQNFDFSPKFWLGSGLEGTPKEEILKNWLITYGIGFSLGKIDFHYVADMKIEGYNVGMYVTSLYGRIYNFNITDCNVCMYIEGDVPYGGQLTNGVLKANGGKDPVALLVGENAASGFSGNTITFESTGKYAVSYLGSSYMTLQNCSFSVTDENAEAPLYVKSGKVAVMNSTFSGGSNHVEILNTVDETQLLNCTANSGELKVKKETESPVYIENNSDDKSIELLTDEYKAADSRRAYQDKAPAKMQLFTVAIPQGEQPEIGAAIQKAIDEAAAAGGGKVYIPAGVYRIETPIIIKSGVELVGANDYFHYINSEIPFSTLLTDYGAGKENAEALITLEPSAGIRGLSVVYDKVSQETIGPYATSIKATGKDCYIINTTVVGGWSIADFNSYKCDNHYIESLNFFTFNRGISIGGGSDGGVLLNAHTNPGEMWSTGFNPNKFSGDWTGPLMTHLHETATFFYFGDCTNEVSFMQAAFGAYRGAYIDGAELYIIGFGQDYSVNDIYITGDSKVTIIDPQCIGSYSSDPYTSTAVVADKNFTGTLNIFNICPWLMNDASIRVDGGNVNIAGGYFFQAGKAPILATGGNVNASGLIVRTRSMGDIIAEKGTKSVTSFGNLIDGSPKYQIASGVKTSGSAFR